MSEEVSVGYISDIHLEASNADYANFTCDILAIVGDLSSDLNLLDAFFRKIPEHIDIVYVPGNHEFEAKLFNTVVPNLKKHLEIFENVTVLYNETVVIKGIKFIGTTLWTDFSATGHQDKVMTWADGIIPDFKSGLISSEDGVISRFTVKDALREHEKAVKFLTFELTSNRSAPSVVLSHFAPHPKSIHVGYSGQIENAYWVNNLEHLMGLCEFWVHGHTHDSFEYQLFGTDVLCNPRGFSKVFNLGTNHKFNPYKKFIITVPSV